MGGRFWSEAGKTRMILAAVVLAGFLPAQVWAASRGIDVVFKDKSGAAMGLYKESHALVIGVSDYTGGWPRLPGAREDVAAVSQMLSRNGFQVHTVENPERKALEAAFNDFVQQYGLEPENRLLFYFAGHGYTHRPAYAADDPDEWMGYIVSRAAPLPQGNIAEFYKHAVSMQWIEEVALKIEAKHALFLFDSCFSGSIFTLNRAVPLDIEERTARPVRQFITSGRADQEVPDVSIFRRQFITALEGEADKNGDGYVTGSELGLFLEETVTNLSRRAQTPQYGKLRHRRLDRGDFVFWAPKAPSGPQPDLDAEAQRLAEERALLETDKQKMVEDKGRLEESQRLAEDRKRLDGERRRISEERERLRQEQERLKTARLDPRKTPLPGRKADTQNMVFLAAGGFAAGEAAQAGSPAPGAFYIDRYEVTQKEFEQAMGLNPSYFKSGGAHPVEQVTWYQALAYCERMGKRLPTELEWEKAARGATSSKYFWGDNPDLNYAWYGEDWDTGHHAVGQKKPNPLGLYDMAGNVWEWTATGDSEDPRYKVLRGGSWINSAHNVRSAHRVRLDPLSRNSLVGFRCVAAPP